MRPRFARLCLVLSALALVALPGLAGAAPAQNHKLTINATPNPIFAGEPVLIYGQLKTTDHASKQIVLYHHVSGSKPGYTVIQTTKTDTNGFYFFTRAPGVVTSNRSWFVREGGNPSVHSRTVFERVSAIVSLSANKTASDTGHAITFSGHVTPNHRGQLVFLQSQRQGAGDDWTTLKAGRLGPGSNYSITYRWVTPGTRNVRVVFSRDNRNLGGASDLVTVTVQQNQLSGFTINTTTPVIQYGQHATITGNLSAPNNSNTAIQLCSRGADQAQAHCNGAGNTQSNGNYSIDVAPPHNTVYYVRTAATPHRRTANLFIGVRDNIKLNALSSTGTVGKGDTFYGSVTPDKTGKTVYLQRKGSDGDFHTVGTGRVQPDGSYAINHVFGTPGSKTFRTRILGGEFNVGAASNQVVVTVSQPPTATLTPAT